MASRRRGLGCWFALLLACLSCGGSEAPPTNILLIVLDDIGPEFLRAYNEAEPLPATPTLDRLAANGVTFRNVWSNPTCSSTRATIQTGRYGFRTGVRPVITNQTQEVLLPREWTLPEALDRATNGRYAHAAIGKWHLGNQRNGGDAGPNVAGYDHFSGTLGAFPSPSYVRWNQTTNGRTATNPRYATSVLVDESLDWIQAQEKPWFLYLAFHSAHRPWHAPPSHLLSERARRALPRATDGSPLPVGRRCPDANPAPCYRAMIEAVSSEIGRLLESLPEETRNHTTVLIVGDNGSPRVMASDPTRATRGKGRLYEGGIHVPLIASGAGVTARGNSSALLNTTDVFATVLELAAGKDAIRGVPNDVPLDARSFAPLLGEGSQPVREFAFAERATTRSDAGNGSALRNLRFKLIRPEAGGDELYDLENDPEEQENLLQRPLSEEAKQAHESLQKALDSLLESAAS